MGATLSSVHGGIINFDRFWMDTFFGLDKYRPLRHLKALDAKDAEPNMDPHN